MTIAAAMLYFHLGISKRRHTDLKLYLLVGSVALSLLVALISMTLDSSPGSQRFVLLSGASLFLFSAVGYQQFFSAYPVLDTKLVHQRRYLVVTFLGAISNVALLTIIYLFPLSLQKYWGYSLTQSSLTFCFVAVLIGVGGYCSGRISAKYEVVCLCCGLCISSVIFYLALSDPSLEFYVLFMCFLAFLLGMTNSLALIASQNASPIGLEGTASGFTKMTMTFSGAMGVVVVGSSPDGLAGSWERYEHSYGSISILLICSLLLLVVSRCLNMYRRNPL